MLLNIITLFILCARLCNATTTYDRYTGAPASDELLSYYESTGVKSTCTMEVKECDATEWRRVDGSCNNLNHPVRGTHFEPVYRVLPAHYYNGSYPTKSIDGTDKTLVRSVRNALLCSEKAENPDFTQATAGYGIFTFVDVASIHDLLYFLQNRTDCCTAEGMKSRECSPNIIPEDDPVHRFSGIRCMNLTTPRVYSDFGCTNDPEPSPIVQATSVFDMSGMYNNGDGGADPIRSFKGGMLTVEVDEKGIIWPPNGDGYCPANQPGETRCFGHYPNVLLQTTLINIWYMRQHNYFAKQLAAVNSCWDDTTLFETARDINIAFATQVFFYEWCAALIGEDNLKKAGVLANCSGHRDVYDDSTYPSTSLEFSYVLRWFHTMQEGSAFMYDTDGTFLKEYPLANLTFRPGFLGVDNNMLHITQHMYRQPSAKIDHGVDPDLLEMGLAYIQEAVDVMTSDLHKSRLLGFAPYIDYVQYCTGHRINSFDDLSEHMEDERIYQMKRVYKHVKDIDLMAGLWAEKLVQGGYIPATLACIITEFLHKAVRFDRHWYERPNRPHAFNEDQLAEVRTSSLAQLICHSADGVVEVQPHAFLNINPDNPLTPCKDIPSIDFTKWADDSCNSYSASPSNSLSEGSSSGSNSEAYPSKSSSGAASGHSSSEGYTQRSGSGASSSDSSFDDSSRRSGSETSSRRSGSETTSRASSSQASSRRSASETTSRASSSQDYSRRLASEASSRAPSSEAFSRRSGSGAFSRASASEAASRRSASEASSRASSWEASSSSSGSEAFSRASASEAASRNYLLDAHIAQVHKMQRVADQNSHRRPLKPVHFKPVYHPIPPQPKKIYRENEPWAVDHQPLENQYRY